MKLGVLTLTFSETMDVSSVTVKDNLFIQSKNDVSGLTDHKHALQGEQVIPRADSTIVKVTLTAADLEAIKLNDNFGTTKANTFVSATSALIKDQAGVSLLKATEDKGVASNHFVADSTAPTLQSFEFNLNAGTITLNFDESVRANTLAPASVGVQDLQVSENSKLFVSKSTTKSANGQKIVIGITSNELDEIKLATTLCVSLASCFLTLGGGSFKDMAGVAILLWFARQTSML